MMFVLLVCAYMLFKNVSLVYIILGALVGLLLMSVIGNMS